MYKFLILSFQSVLNYDHVIMYHISYASYEIWQLHEKG